MGDRANIFIGETLQGGNFEGVYLYTHWGGSDLPRVLQDALRKRWRWNDDQYLARIIFCEMVKGQEDMETGYGISAYLTDGNDRILKVDTGKGTITRITEWPKYEELKTWSFPEYCALDEGSEIPLVWRTKGEESNG